MFNSDQIKIATIAKYILKLSHYVDSPSYYEGNKGERILQAAKSNIVEKKKQ